MPKVVSTTFMSCDLTGPLASTKYFQGRKGIFFFPLLNKESQRGFSEARGH